MVFVKHALVDVDAIADQYHLSKHYFWKLFKDKKAASNPNSGVTKTGRLYRIEPDRFEHWFLGIKDHANSPSPPPPTLDHQEQPTRRAALTTLTSRMDVIQADLTAVKASVTSQGEKIDRLSRIVMRALKIGVNHASRRP